MDMMAQLRDRINRRRAGISGSRQMDADNDKKASDLPPTPTLAKSLTMPNVKTGSAAIIADDEDEELGASPISMGGIANALRAKASNMSPESDDDDDDWEDD